MSITLRPLSTGELLDQTLTLYRSHFGLFVGIAAIAHLFSLLLRLGGLQLGVQQGSGNLMANLGLGFVIGMIALCMTAASQAATVVAVSHVYLDRPATVLDSYARIMHLILRIVFLTILVGIGIGLGILLLIVPGLILATMWSLAVPAAVLENKGINAAISRSSDLTKGDRWRIFGILLLFGIFSIVIGVALGAIIGWAAGVNPAFTGAPLWAKVAVLVGGFFTQALIGPLLTIALSLVYYDERVRKEAFDLQLMMAAIDSHQPGLAQTT